MSESSVPAPAATPKIEVLAVRDPDGPPEVYVLVDGAEAPFSFESVDPGAGHDIEGWREHTETVRENESYSEAFKRLVVEARIAHEDSEYIEGDRTPVWTFFGHWEDSSVVIDLVLPGEHEDTREQDDERWPEGLWCDSGRGDDVDEARADALSGYKSASEDDEARDLAACRTETDFERHIQKYGR